MYQALYRKYRPKTFEDLAGQQYVITTLKNALKAKKISHAYLFSGPRGVGKTTVAKILAKAINCENLENGEPCNECSNCLEVLNKKCVDIVEIDAASNNGVDEIRELKNKINLVPSSLKYKCYIIDEVHMLSIGAFNALLKTLEEPPEHVVFILATTEIHKVPETVLSRCQCYNFTKISVEDTVNRLKKVIQQEKINVDEFILDEIAKASDGSLRDALGLLDQLSSFNKEKITIDLFEKIRGVLNTDKIKDFLDTFYNNEREKILQLIQTFDKTGIDFVKIIDQIIQYLRDELIDFYLNHKQLDYPDEKIIRSIQQFDAIQNKIKHSNNTKIMFEIEILNLMKEKSKIISREIKYDSKIENKDVLENQTDNKKSEFIEKPIENIIDDNKIDVKINNIFARAKKEKLLYIKNNIEKFNDFIFDTEVGYIICMILDGNLRVASDEGLIISYEYASMVEKALEKQKLIEEQFSKILDIDINVVFITDEQWEKLKEDFIFKKKNKIKYQYIENIENNEQKIPDQKLDNNDKIISNEEQKEDAYKTAIDLFGKNVVEME